MQLSVYTYLVYKNTLGIKKQSHVKSTSLVYLSSKHDLGRDQGLLKLNHFMKLHVN